MRAVSAARGRSGEVSQSVVRREAGHVSMNSRRQLAVRVAKNQCAVQAGRGREELSLAGKRELLAGASRARLRIGEPRI